MISGSIYSQDSGSAAARVNWGLIMQKFAAALSRTRKVACCAAIFSFGMYSFASAQNEIAGAPGSCVPQGQMEAVVVEAMPDLLHQLSKVCAHALPATALLRQDAGGLIKRFDEEAQANWPQAKTAFIALTKMPEEDSVLLSDPKIGRALLSAMLVGSMSKMHLTDSDCVSVENILKLLAPLPPKDIVSIVVSFMQIASSNDGEDKKPGDLSICSGTQP